MTERSYPFDAGTGATITEAQWKDLASKWQDNGVEDIGPSGNALKVSSVGTSLTLSLTAGHANIFGFHYENDATRSLAFVANAVANPRIDRVVLRLDFTANSISVVVKQGTAAASPTAPTVDRTGASPEISLATFTVPASSSSVPSVNVTDARDFIGKRVQVKENTADLVEGDIGYKPSSGKFYAKGPSTAIELGAPPDLSGYSLTSHTHGSTPGGITICTSTTRPASPTLGMHIFETNTDRSYVWQYGGNTTNSWKELVVDRPWWSVYISSTTGSTGQTSWTAVKGTNMSASYLSVPTSNISTPRTGLYMVSLTYRLTASANWTSSHTGVAASISMYNGGSRQAILTSNPPPVIGQSLQEGTLSGLLYASVGSTFQTNMSVAAGPSGITVSGSWTSFEGVFMASV